MTFANQPTFSQEPPERSAAGAAVRPKVLRRPAQFSTGVASSEPMESVSESPVRALAITERVAAEPSRLPWQEDGRFGLALFGMIAALNILLVLCLPAMRHTASSAAGTDIRDTANLQPTRGRPSGVTIYAQPSADWRSTELFDMRSLTSDDNRLAVSPQDIPAPEAHALSSDEQ